MLNATALRRTVLSLAASLPLFAGTAAHAAAEIGQPAPPFTAQGADGKSVSLASFKGKTVVLEWTNHECPFVVKHYESGNIPQLQKEFTAKGVVWLQVISSAPDKQGHVDGPSAIKINGFRNATPSGAGKSSFIHALPRFYETTAGRITIDGIDIRDLRLADLRGQIAIVAQDTVLFRDSIMNNIRLGRQDATEAEIMAAARAAHAHDFITHLPEGYQTVVGERGASLSGGQRQRIAIARAFLKDAPILILDEATSALDSESEAMIQQSLAELIQGRTTFMIAHRFSSIRHATRILVFDQGSIVADGTHETLHVSSPVYRDLYNHQLLGGEKPRSV